MPAPPPSRLRFWLVQAVTAARVPLAVVFAALLLNAGYSPTVVWLGAVTLLIIEVSDGLDGFLARRLGVASEWGATLDPYCDSVSRMIVYWTLASANLTFSVIVLVMAVRDVTVANCRMAWIRQGRSVAAKWSGKIKAVVQGAGAFVLLFAPLFFEPISRAWVAAVTSWLVIGVTVYSGLDYVARLKDKRDP